MNLAAYLMSFLLIIGAIYPEQRSLEDIPDSTRYAPSVGPDVAKPHPACPQAECWDDCTDNGYDNTSTQATAANAIYYLCSFWCFNSAQDVYQSLVDFTGNAGLFPEDEAENIIDWLRGNCPLCSLEVRIAHKGYANQNPVYPEYVSFEQVQAATYYAAQVQLWVVSSVELPDPPAPTSRSDLSQMLTYLNRAGDQAIVHDPDCDLNGKGNNFYQMGLDSTGEYLKDYFGPGNDGYLHGIIFITEAR
jgi:hypothetical protein